MEVDKKKCSYKGHENINADIYCKKCEIYMCNKCESHHSKLCSNHQNFIINKNIEEINDEFCEEEAHNHLRLKYYCKSHGVLCCGACIAKIKGKGDGQHINCDVCCIEDIKDEKKSKIKGNIELLKELSSKFNKSFNDIKKIYEEMNEKKENLKLRIQKIFTNIRNILNNREDELLLNVDQKYDNIYFKKDIIRDIEKLPNKIKSSLEKCKSIEAIDNNIYKLIKESNEIENNINIINNINSNISDIYESKNNEIIFIPEEGKIDEFINDIKKFGKIIISNPFDLKLSSIIKEDKNNFELITKWIEETINKKIKKYELIFKMSENGTNSKYFHKICNDKGPTLTLVKTTNNKIFGGFTPLNWNNEGGCINDKSNQTFIFSLNLKKKYNMNKQNGYGIDCYPDYGPNFGNCDFYLKENMKEGATYANNNCNFLSNKNLELTGGKGDHEDFETEEFEVYKVIY